MTPRASIRKYRIAIAVLSVFLAGSLLSHCSRPAEKYPVDQTPQLTETWSFGNGSIKTARISLTGVIMREYGSGIFSKGTDPVATVLRQIRTAKNDPKIKAIILEINSPGGGVTPSDEIHHALNAFRASQNDRHVVAFVRDMGASGAYYAAMASDMIIAEPTSIVGSIGVIMQSLNMEGLAEKIGITDVTIKSGKNKDLLNPFRSADTNQMALMQEMINRMQARFVDLVTDSRPIDPLTQPEIFDGRIFDASQALDHGLIDHIGYWDDVVAHTSSLFGTNDIRIVRYKKETSFFDALGSLQSRIQLPALKTVHGPRFMYIWEP